MIAPSQSRFRIDLVTAILRTCLVCQFLLYAPVAVAENASSISSADTSTRVENKHFIGQMQVVGTTDASEDVFIFQDGKFVSQSCLDWGFTPAPYWVRPEADGLHFLAELTSPDHGKMRFQGVYKGETINGTVQWRKERWYWTAEQEYRFSGQLAGTNGQAHSP